MIDQPIDLGKDVVEEGFARGYVPHARAGKLREHVVRIVARVSAFWGTKRRLAFVQVISKAMFTPCDSRIRLISAFARAPAMPTLGIVGEKCVCGCKALSTRGAATASSALRSEASQPSLHAAESAAWLLLAKLCETELDFARRNEGCAASE